MVQQDIDIMSPYGLQDLFEWQIKPSPYFQEDKEGHSTYVKRIKGKKWNEI